MGFKWGREWRNPNDSACNGPGKVGLKNLFVSTENDFRENPIYSGHDFRSEGSKFVSDFEK